MPRTKYVTVSESTYSFFLNFYNAEYDSVDKKFIVTSVKPNKNNLVMFVEEPDMPLDFEDLKQHKSFYQMTEREFMKKGIMTNYEKSNIS